MTNANTSLADYEALLDCKERDLILQRDKVWKFLNTDHTSADIKKYQARVRKSDAELGAILRALLDNHDASSQFRAEAQGLCQRARGLNIYTKGMDDALSQDLLEKRLIEDKKSIDVIKNLTFLLAVPVAFMTAIKDGFAGGHFNVYQAAGTGVGFSTTILARKRILEAFKSAKKITL